LRFFYNVVVYLLTLPYVIYWLWRAVINPAMRPKLVQRFGFAYPRLSQSTWLHAVSVGEVVAAEPLIRTLLDEFPERDVLVTTVTPTGAERVRRTFGDAVQHAYIPFESPDAVRRFFKSVEPAIALIVETEIWPNLYRGCGLRGIPLVLVSARISPRSVSKYRKLLPLFRETLSHGIVIAAQSRADAERFISLGASGLRTRVTGNIKFDIQLPPGLPERGKTIRRDQFGYRPVWLAASTHEGEESIVLDAHERLLEQFPELLLVLVPRHPERFDVVADFVEKHGLTLCRRTDGIAVPASVQVFLGDTMCELMQFYAASDLALVGGSLVPIGGHNLLEPGALGLPILTGPYTFNAEEIAEQFIDQRACRVVETSDDIVREVTSLMLDEEAARQLGDSARRLIDENRGALAELMAVIRPLLGRAPTPTR
jgi:3-deoxy-D-manno-octulosonic-acid transferase